MGWSPETYFWPTRARWSSGASLKSASVSTATFSRGICGTHYLCCSLLYYSRLNITQLDHGKTLISRFRPERYADQLPQQPRSLLIAMTSTASRVTIARPSRSNGVLSIPASATQKRTGPASEGLVSRVPLARLKIIIRRLPPGLTQSEFEEALGDDWKARGDKVDWAVYKEGKVSRE